MTTERLTQSSPALAATEQRVTTEATPANVRCNDGLAVTRVVWVSGGKDSTAMALRLAELHPDVPWRYVCTPTRNELPDVHDHWERLGSMPDATARECTAITSPGGGPTGAGQPAAAGPIGGSRKEAPKCQ